MYILKYINNKVNIIMHRFFGIICLPQTLEEFTGHLTLRNLRVIAVISQSALLNAGRMVDMLKTLNVI